MVENIDFYEFYQSQLGQKINNALIDKFNSLKVDIFNKQVLEIGYPLLAKNLKAKKTERIISCVIPKFAKQAFKAQENGENVLIAKDCILPFSNCFFDIVILNHSLEHSDNLSLFLKEVWRILADGGIVIIVMPSFFNLLRFIKKTPYYQTKSYFALVIEQFLKENKFTLKKTSSFKSFPNRFLLLQAEKKVFAPILTANTKLEKTREQKYAAAINCSSNFGK